MSMDILFIEAVAAELREKIRGAAVSKIHQPGPAELLLRLWNGRENLRLFLCASPGAGRLHLTEAKLPNPAAPPRFCQLLRSRLSRLLELERLPGERIVRLLFAGGEGERWTLMAELLGQRPNLILLDSHDRIVDALYRIAGEGEGREVLPGLLYRAPEQPRRIDLAEGLPEIPADRDFNSWILENLSPMTPLVAADLTAAVARGKTPEEVLGRFRERWLARDLTPWIGVREGKQVLAAYLPEYITPERIETFPSPSVAADAFYRGEAEVFGGGREELERVVRKELQRLRKRLRHIEDERDKALRSVRQRELGDLLLANLHRLKRGMAEVVLEDWYADPPAPVALPLDPALTPQENAERFFKLHRKGKRGLEHTERRRAETLAEMEWLEGAALALEEAEGAEELEAIRQELAAAGMIRIRPEPGRRTVVAGPQEQLRRTMSPGGFLIYWGKNNRSNDHISRQVTGPDDLWFHAHNMPGCHLVLKRGAHRGEIPEADVLHAASIAAAYSRGKEAGKVEVMVAEGKWVRKPKGARPGLVTVERYRTVVVKPLKP
jgi:predicted ribosome quality control (RQC) complex YloA/Tae2 family protein